MQIIKREHLQKLMSIFLCMMLIAITFNVFEPTTASAISPDTLEITGDGVTNPVTFTREQLEGMKQHQEVYSCINTWPTKKWYVGKGVKLWDLLLEAGIKEDEAKLITFTSTDSYTVTLTIEELFHDTRYRFPYFKDGKDGDGHLPGSAEEAVKVEPLVGLVSVEGSDNPKYMNDMNTFLLMLGQRAVTEQTGNLFVKYLSKIEVSTAEPEQWDAPQANPASGTVPKGTMLTLSNLHNDDDKVYYTTDGSDPTFNSPMYNWIASRWWSSREDVLGKINRPIGPINEDTIIKAVTIGPGRRNSDIVTFTYKVEGAGGEAQLNDIIGHWAEDGIKKLVASGAVSGYPDNSFKPDNNITRAEFTTVLIKMLDLSSRNGKDFADTADHWARDTISTAAQHGIVTGYNDNTFGPDEPITREQMAVMIVRAAELMPETGKLNFADNNKISDWAEDSMITAVQNGIINGYPDNTVRPQGLATRAEAVTVIVKALAPKTSQ